MTKRILSIILMLWVLLSGFSVSAEDYNESNLYNALLDLNNYMLRQEDKMVRLDEIIDMLEYLGNYKEAPLLLDYVYLLKSIEEGNATDIELYSWLMGTTDNYANTIEVLRRKKEYSALVSVEKLLTYAQGYLYELNGDYQSALDAYKNTTGVLDTRKRMLEVGRNLNGVTSDQISTSTATIINGIEYERTRNVIMECQFDHVYDSFAPHDDIDCLDSFGKQSGIRRHQVLSISFIDTLKDAPSDSYDISLMGDNSVRMWFMEAGERVSDSRGDKHTGYHAYIGANGTVYAAESVSGLFFGYMNCKKIDFGGCFNTGMSKNMRYMFYGCTSLTSLDANGLDTKSVTDMGSMFKKCTSLTTLDGNWFDTVNVRDMSSMFDGCTSLKALDVSGFDTVNVRDMSGMFYGCTSLTALDVSGFDTGNVTNMLLMFSGCSSLKVLDVSGFDTGYVTDMCCMFQECSSLTALDVSGFDTVNVRDMSSMFYGCTSLTALDVSGFDTGNVTNMLLMFSGCSSLKVLDVSGFDTGDVRYMSYMFSGCSSLTTLDVSGFATGNVTDMYAMFYSCASLTALDVSGFDTRYLSDACYMFCECTGLELIVINKSMEAKLDDGRDFDGVTGKVCYK